MPPIPPGGIGGVFFLSGISVTNASVVSNRPAMDAAFCSAERVTWSDRRFPPLPGRCIRRSRRRSLRCLCASSLPRQRARLRARIVGKLTRRLFNRAADNRHADFLIAFKALDVIERFCARSNATPPPGTMPFLHRRTRSVQRVFDPSFLLFSSRSRSQRRR